MRVKIPVLNCLANALQSLVWLSIKFKDPTNKTTEIIISPIDTWLVCLSVLHPKPKVELATPPALVFDDNIHVLTCFSDPNIKVRSNFPPYKTSSSNRFQ